MIFSHPSPILCAALDTLGQAFTNLPWNFLPVKTELVSQWLGAPEEDIMVVTFRG